MKTRAPDPPARHKHGKDRHELPCQQHNGERKVRGAHRRGHDPRKRGEPGVRLEKLSVVRKQRRLQPLQHTRQINLGIFSAGMVPMHGEAGERQADQREQIRRAHPHT